jgi:hypothetical protein
MSDMPRACVTISVANDLSVATLVNGGQTSDARVNWSACPEAVKAREIMKMIRIDFIIMTIDYIIYMDFITKIRGLRICISLKWGQKKAGSLRPT